MVDECLIDLVIAGYDAIFCMNHEVDLCRALGILQII